MAIQNNSILSLCTGNSFRSQIAEGLAKKHLSKFTIESAGTRPESINPIAIKIMKEINFDISNQYSKSISDNKLETFDIIITLCGDAKDECLNLSDIHNKHIHWGINDPAKVEGTNEEKVLAFRKTREQIMHKILNFSKKLPINI